MMYLGKLIDINKVMENAGVTKNFEPRLAIARADWKDVCFHKKDSGRGFFAMDKQDWYQKNSGDIDLPPETFTQWSREKEIAVISGINKQTAGYQIGI